MVTLTSILELAQLESSHKIMTFKEINMSELLKDVVGKFEDRITSKNLHLSKIIGNDLMVVEDNETNLEVLSIYLEERFVIEKAMTGEMAVKLATLNDYDLILMDINLGPEMDGIEATREIRKMSKNTHIPVIAVTGYATDQEKQAILEQGLNAHIVKPFTRQEILTLIDQVLTP